MYDRPELRDTHQRFWHAIRAGLSDAPEALSYPDDLWALWDSPDLYFTQACGLPYRCGLHARVTLIGTPDFGLQGCPPGYYRSCIVTRCDNPRRRLTDFADARLAYNEPHSQSGWSAIFHHARQHGVVFKDLLSTGGHLASALAVAEGRADLAAIDAQSWRLMQRYDDWTRALHVIDHTDPTPGTPYITADSAAAPDLARAISRAITALTQSDRDALGIRDLVPVPHEAYMALPVPERPDQFLSNAYPRKA
ncbi:MAG: PhnD/SsuA/transferrin family substrate-binding protein [Pseudomonadota bacterium]